MKLLNKIGDINGTVLSMEPNAAQQHLGQSARAAFMPALDALLSRWM